MILVNYIVHDVELEEYQYDIANINNDDVIDILDIIMLLNQIMDPSLAVPSYSYDDTAIDIIFQYKNI